LSIHASFASQGWIINQVAFGMWEPKGNHYQVTTKETSGSEKLKIRIKFIHHPNGGPEYPTDYVHVYGAHTVGSKKRRR
jgi:hypothetical protein